MLLGVEKLDKLAAERKRQNNKDIKEIEKLKSKVETISKQNQEMKEQITKLTVDIRMAN